MAIISLRDIIVEPPADGEVVDPVRWFDSPGPLEIEIGCGKGGFLLNRATAHPHLRLLGIEWANKYFRYCADRMMRWGLRNVRVMRTDARHFFIHHVASASVSTLHVYHPDPWPKKRHHKRRLIRPDFVDAAVRALRPGGFWLLQTDHREYYEVIRAMLDDRNGLAEIAWDQAGVSSGADWTGTNFEVKYVRDGRPIHRVAYRAL